MAGGKGDHVDLAKSWTELGLLAQCSNQQVQEGKIGYASTAVHAFICSTDSYVVHFWLQNL